MNVQEELLRTKIDPHVTRENLEALAQAARNEKAAVAGFEVLSGGCWNRVLGVEFEGDHPGLVFKISPHREDAKILNEYRVHQRFFEIEALRTPEPYLLDTSERLIPGTVFIMERIPGRVMHSCFGALDGGERERITRTIAADLAELHRIRERGFGSCADSPENRAVTWPGFWLPRFDGVMREVQESGLLKRDFLDRIQALRPSFAPALEIGDSGVLTHYDIWSGNVMIDLEDPAGPRVSGYIDISGYYADYVRELSFAEMFGIADGLFYRVYQQQHEIDSGFRLRASIYNLKMSLKHVMMYPSEGYYRRLAADCLAFIEADL